MKPFAENLESSYDQEEAMLISSSCKAAYSTTTGACRQQGDQDKKKFITKGRPPSMTTKKNISTTTKARKNIGSYRRTKRGGDFYDTWKGRVSVHMKVKYFDLKLLVKKVFGKTSLFLEDGWEMMEFYDVIRLSLPASSTFFPSSAAATLTSTSNPSVCFETAPPSEGGIDLAATTSIPPPVDLLDDHPFIPKEKEKLETSIIDVAQQSHEEYTKESLSTIQEEGASTPEIYIFSFGAVVFWNFRNEENEEEWMDKYIFASEEQRYQQQQVDGDERQNGEEVEEAIGEANHADAVERANDEIDFMYGTTYQIKSDVVQLQTREFGEKMAFSFALAKSAMLSIFEWRLDQAIERNSSIPEQLVKYGRIPMSSKDISMEIGRIYLVKSGINLENNVLDTPEEFWEDDKFNEEYEKAMTYFDIMSRLDLVNTRLEVMQDMNQILIEAAQNHHASLLEWAIIVLIIVEIIVEVFRTYRDFLDN